MNFSELAFVSTDNSGEQSKIKPWNPRRTGDYAKDCALGRDYFDELYRIMVRNDEPLLLNRVLADQVRGGVWDGVEIGFSQAMSDKLILTAPASQA